MHKRKLGDVANINSFHNTSQDVYSLYEAINEGNIEDVQTWCDSELDFSSIIKEYNITPLHWAAEKGNIKIAQILLNAGFDPQELNSENKTALEVAIQNNHIPLVEMYINYTSIDSPFNTLHDIAAFGTNEQLKFLLTHGGDPKILTQDTTQPQPAEAGWLMI